MSAPGLPIAIITILLGLVVLTSGRNLFWFFVACIGFVAGFQYAPLLWETDSEWLLLIFALVLGLGGALLAVFFKRVAIVLVGFAAGGYIAMSLLALFGLGLGAGPLAWIPYVIGGVLGAVLFLVGFDWALIIFSSFAGAGMVVHGLALAPFLETLLFFILAALGIAIQATMFRRSSGAPASGGGAS